MSNLTPKIIEPPKTPPNGDISPINDIDDIILDEYRKSPQFVYAQERVKRLPPPLKLKLDKFNWNKGYFREQGLPLPVTLGSGLLLALLMTITPPVLVYGKLIPNAYPLFSTSAPVNLNVLVEILRGVFLAGVPLLVFILIQITICLIPYLTFKAYRARNLDVEEKLRIRIEQFLSIREYLGYSAASIVLAVLAQFLYPLPAAPTTAPVVTAATGGGKEAKAAVPLEAVQSWVQSYRQRPYQFYVTNGSLALAVIYALLFVEKLLVRMVAYRYHAHGLDIRIHINKFARHITSQLKKHFLSIHPELEDRNWDNGLIIFSSIGKQSISREDFYPYMDEADAVRYFTVIDPDVVGSLSMDQFLAAIDSLYLEQSAIDRAMLDQSRIIARFDGLLMIFFWIAAIIVTMLVMDPSTRLLIGIMFSFVGGFFFLFSNLAKQAFESIVFVLFTHPFDADDYVIIDNIVYRVHELGLWESSYVTIEGQLTYMPNRILSSKAIVNLRRSPIMTEFVSLSVMPTTSREKIRKLELKLIEWLKENQRDYVPVMFIRGFKVIDKEHMILDLSISHRSNFNDMVKKEFRSRKFVLYLRECITELGIELSPPLAAR